MKSEERVENESGVIEQSDGTKVMRSIGNSWVKEAEEAEEADEEDEDEEKERKGSSG